MKSCRIIKKVENRAKIPTLKAGNLIAFRYHGTSNAKHRGVIFAFAVVTDIRKNPSGKRPIEIHFELVDDPCGFIGERVSVPRNKPFPTLGDVTPWVYPKPDKSRVEKIVRNALNNLGFSHDKFINVVILSVGGIPVVTTTCNPVRHAEVENGIKEDIVGISVKNKKVLRISIRARVNPDTGEYEFAIGQPCSKCTAFLQIRRKIDKKRGAKSSLVTWSVDTNKFQLKCVPPVNIDTVTNARPSSKARFLFALKN